MIPELPRAEFVPPDPQSILLFRTFWRRAFAALADGSLMILASSGLLFLGGLLRQGTLYPGYLTFSLLVSLFYTALLTYRYGGTLGKLLFGVKVVKSDALDQIGIGQSFLREVPNVLISMGSITIALLILRQGGADALLKYFNTKQPTVYSRINQYISYAYLVLELGTCLFSQKRRAVHDFLAGTVAIRAGKARWWYLPLLIVVIVAVMALNLAAFKFFKNAIATQ